MKSKLFNSKTLAFIIIFVIYAVFVLISLTKEPYVFKDEVVFANNAHYLLDKNKFSELSNPFSGQLSAPENLLVVVHPPAYYWLLAITTHFFGLNIYTVRLTSFFIGLLLLFLFFSILKKIINNDTLALSVLFLFAVDQAFIRSSRFGRPDILVAFFMTLALLFYIKTFEEHNIRNYILTGLFSGLAFMTHLFQGLIPLVVISLHFLLTKRFKTVGFKKLLFLTMPALIFFILWLVFWVFPIFLHDSGLFKYTLSFIPHRALAKSKNLYSALQTFKEGSIAYEQARFYIYIILFFPLIFFLRNKSGIKSFLILAYLFIYPYMLLIATIWYLVLFTPIACLAFAFLIREKNKYQKLIIALLVIVISSSIATQVRIIRKRWHYSYENYSKQLSNYLPIGAKVLIVDAYPDPYFYFASQRKDLRLEYSHARVITMIGFGDRTQEAIKTADYIIIGQSLKDIIEHKYHPIYNFLISYILSNSQSYVSDYGQVIFNMGRTVTGD